MAAKKLKRVGIKIHVDNGVGKKVGFDQWIGAYEAVWIKTRNWFYTNIPN